MKISCLETEKAVGKILFHDITQIKKGAFKGPRFKKGHVIRGEDVEVLLDLGKKHIYSIEMEAGEVHEEEAGLRTAAALRGCGLLLEGPSEGRVNLLAARRGLLKINVSLVNTLNSLPDMVVSTLHTHTPVEKGQKVAATRVIPLVVREELLEKVEAHCQAAPSPPVTVVPYKTMRVAAVITGREVKEGRIRDAFAPVLQEKVDFFGFEPLEFVYVEDDVTAIAGHIEGFLKKGIDLIMVTGGMSVDPDDVTPTAIKRQARVVKYGAPVLPGAMFLLAYAGEVPVIGLPACAMYFKNTVLDILLPRIVTGEKLTAADIASLGHGGLCHSCDSCVFPNCSFGKGGV